MPKQKELGFFYSLNKLLLTFVNNFLVVLVMTRTTEHLYVKHCVDGQMPLERPFIDNPPVEKVISKLRELAGGNYPIIMHNEIVSSSSIGHSESLLDLKGDDWKLCKMQDFIVDNLSKNKSNSSCHILPTFSTKVFRRCEMQPLFKQFSLPVKFLNRNILS
ncbi:hypothetical protein BX667DRAFT_338869 [Coemansia mojavensis]|nr:hypothetical protein BX667DRAFT_338869 [Coemansia mojavensis]